jgi:hypothetical protein
MKSKIEEVFARLLEELEQGKSIQDCLRRYPDLADELEPMLRLALEIERLPEPQPDVQHVRETADKVRRQFSRRGRAQKRVSFKPLFRWHPALIRTAAAVCVIFFFSWTTVLLSAKSLPGEPLYGVKRLGEKIQYFFAVAPQGKAELHIVFADKRTDEFVHTFKPGEPLDEALLTDMLTEVQHAIEYAELLQEDKSQELRSRIMYCNEQQLTVLQLMKEHACECDRDIIMNAIHTCTERHNCLGCDGSIQNNGCPCIE